MKDFVIKRGHYLCWTLCSHPVGNTVETEAFNCLVWAQLQTLPLKCNPVLWVWKEELAETKNIKNISLLEVVPLLLSSFLKVQPSPVSRLRKRTGGLGRNRAEFKRTLKIVQPEGTEGGIGLWVHPVVCQTSVKHANVEFNGFEHRELSVHLWTAEWRWKTLPFYVLLLFVESEGCILLSRRTNACEVEVRDLMWLRTRQLLGASARTNP